MGAMGASNPSITLGMPGQQKEGGAVGANYLLKAHLLVFHAAFLWSCLVTY